MALTETTYYGLTRVREQGPESKDWAAVDRNPEVVSLLLHAFEQHAHSGTAGIKHPGYHVTTPVLPTLSEQTTGGVLSPGTTVGVRLSYIDALGLETDASSETAITTSVAASRPLTPTLTSKQVAASALPGGSYVYAITKRKGTGETPISDILPVDIPYDNTYSVTIGFEAISTYSDGTTGINIYRSTGLNSAFQLLTTVTNTATTSYTDANVIPPENVNVQPPVNNTFDANKKIRIDWSTITHPPAAKYLKIYVTNQAGLWSVDHLLTTIDLTGTPANYVDFLGNETLASGWPLNTTQVPSTPPKINLSTEASGGLNATADSDFNGFKAYEMVLGTTSVNTNGAIWYDSTNHKVKAFANGAEVILSPAKSTRNEIYNPGQEINSTNWDGHDATTWITGFTEARNTTVLTPELHATFAVGWTTFNTSGNATIRPAISIGNGTNIKTNGLQNKWVYVSCWVRATLAGLRPRFVISRYQSDGNWIADTTITTNQYPGATDALVANTWTRIDGWTQVSSATYSIDWIKVEFINVSGSALGAGTFYAGDSLVVVDTIQPTTAFQYGSYFNGQSPGAYWTGTAYNSPSISGAFSHGVEEAGGHKADNITFAGVNVATVLSRIADSTTGARKKVQTVSKAVGTTVSPTVSADGYDDADSPLPQMSVTLTPDFSGQEMEIYFTCSLQLTIPTAQTTSFVSIILEANGVNLDWTELAQTAVTSNQHITFSPTWVYSAPSGASITYKVRAKVMSGATATLLGTRRQLAARLVF